MPPHLAGREAEKREFERLLDQRPVLQNVVLTGLRGVGKTVLLETLKPMAITRGWSWVGTDLSESTSVSETNLAIRLLTDLSVVTSSVVIEVTEKRAAGLVTAPEQQTRHLDFDALMTMYASAPGLVVDKLKNVLELVSSKLVELGHRGVIFAYDEAQNMADRADKDEYPLSMLLDLFQSLQRRDFPYMLVLAGLPTLFPKLVEARTYAERMFHVITVDKLSEADSREAIVKPIVAEPDCPVTFTNSAVGSIYRITRGYPYFLQYVCREAFDIWAQQVASGQTQKSIPRTEILHKLDSDFFAGRWAKATDRQRDLLHVVASLDTASSEFTVQEIVERSSKVLNKPFKGSHANQMLSQLGDAGLVYKNRWGRYCLAVPLFDEFIKRQKERGGRINTT